MNVHGEVDHPITPELVLEALTDFSEQRPELWPDLDPERYQVHEVGDSWALVTEGSRSPKVWARERYDWSQPSRVIWTVEESNFCKPGSAVSMRVEAGDTAGSHLVMDWDRSPSNMKGALIGLVMLLMGKRVLSSDLAKSLDNIQKLRG